jgi:ferredoxin-NADP reductase
VLVHHVEKGSRMLISGFTGPYHLPDNVLEKTDHLVHITAGSGSVPNWAMLKHAVTFIPQLQHTFIYSNKTWDDIILPRCAERILRASTATRSGWSTA